MTRHRHIHIHDEGGLAGALYSAAGHIRSAAAWRERQPTDDVLHQEYSKVKHLASVQAAVRAYKSVYAKGGPELKEAENRLNAEIEKALSPKGTGDVEPSAIRAALADYSRTPGGLNLPGARKLREALSLQDRNPARAAELFAAARYDLAKLRGR